MQIQGSVNDVGLLAIIEFFLKYLILQYSAIIHFAQPISMYLTSYIIRKCANFRAFVQPIYKNLVAIVCKLYLTGSPMCDVLQYCSHFSITN